MTSITQEQIMTDLAMMLGNFHGHEYSGQIGPHTLFFSHLGLASIDVVVLGETIEEHYGRKIPFNEFMAELGRRSVRDIELGELVHFLHRHLSSRNGA